MDLSGKEANASAREETREYVWNYWSFHADERLRTFHFYILVVTVLVAGTLAYLKDARTPILACIGGIALPIVSFVFWRLDCRVRTMIHRAESILKSIEESIPTDVVAKRLRLFRTQENRHEAQKRLNRRGKSWLYREWNYPRSFYDCFKWIFITFSAMGILIVVVSVLLPDQSSAPPAQSPQMNFYIAPLPLTSPAQGSPPK
jgi:hypothetical protein